jgi:hypothetical protein
VVEVATSILEAGEHRSAVAIRSNVGRPDALPADAAVPVL